MTRIVFFGTPDYVIPVLEALYKEYDIAAVVTQPPKAVGRTQQIALSPVAKWAEKHNIPILDDSPKNLAAKLGKFGATLGILEAYGRILPEDVLNVFPKGIINVHPSLLPKYRGASPVEAAIAAGDTETGITVIRLTQELDAGPILEQWPESIHDDDTKETLRRRLFLMAAEKIVKTIPDYLADAIDIKKQDRSKAIYTTLLKKEHGFIPPKYITAALAGITLEEEWQIPFIIPSDKKNYSVVPIAQQQAPLIAQCLEHFIRAVTGWPGAYTELRIKKNNQKELRRLKILKAHVEDGKLLLDQVQLEGKKPVTWKQFLEGYPYHSLT